MQSIGLTRANINTVALGGIESFAVLSTASPAWEVVQVGNSSRLARVKDSLIKRQ